MYRKKCSRNRVNSTAVNSVFCHEQHHGEQWFLMNNVFRISKSPQWRQKLNKSQLRRKKKKVTTKTAARVYAEARPPKIGSSDAMRRISRPNSSLQNRLVRWGVPPLYKLFSRFLSIRCGTKSHRVLAANTIAWQTPKKRQCGCNNIKSYLRVTKETNMDKRRGYEPKTLGNSAAE